MQPQNDISIPEKKLYYAMGEVCRITGVKDNILRNWEKDFPQLRPKRNKAGVRSYRDKDIQLILYIKHLLHDEQYTIPGAKKRIAEERRAERTGVPIVKPENKFALQSDDADVIEDVIDDIKKDIQDDVLDDILDNDLFAPTSTTTSATAQTITQAQATSSPLSNELIAEIRSGLDEVLKILEEKR